MEPTGRGNNKTGGWGFPGWGGTPAGCERAPPTRGSAWRGPRPRAPLAPSGLQTFAQSIMPVLVDPGVGRDDGRARLAPHHPMKIQNRFRKTLRILLRRIVPDLVEHAPLVLRTEMLGVPLGILYRVHPVDGAVNIDGRDVDFRLSRQSRLDAGVARIARGVLQAVAIGVNDDIDKIHVCKRHCGPLERRDVERPAGRP